MNIEKQLEDWKELKRLCNVIRLSRGLTRKETLKTFYAGVKKYCDTYETKFDFINPPK